MRVFPSSVPSASMIGDVSKVRPPSSSKTFSTTAVPVRAAAAAKVSVVGPGIGSARSARLPVAGLWGWKGSKASSAKQTRSAP